MGDICPVGKQEDGEVLSISKDGKEMTIDSGAVDTVIPPDMVPQIPLRETQASKDNRHYVAANDSKMAIRGRKHCNDTRRKVRL